MRRMIPLLLLAGCAPANNPDPCPQGICLGGDGGSGGADLAAPGGCVESWSCTQWTSAGGGMYTRTCFDQNSCGTTQLQNSMSQYAHAYQPNGRLISCW